MILSGGDERTRMDEYVIGQDDLPQWIRDRMMVYQSSFGGICYEIWGRYRDLVCRDGDVLVVSGENISIIRKHQEHQEQ
jgi:hypothetical protein